MELLVYRCTVCKHTHFANTDKWGLKKDEDKCPSCGSRGTLKLLPKDKYKLEPLNGMTVAWFYERCPECLSYVWLPWLNGQIDYDFCTKCEEMKKQITAHMERHKDDAHEELVKKDIEDRLRHEDE